MLFDCHQVINTADKKTATVKYLKIRTVSLWKITIAWADLMRTYEEFITEIFTLYPGVVGNCTYTIGHYTCAGILTALDLGEYYRRFILISWYLISKRRLAIQEQSRFFFRGMQGQLEARVCQRLQQTFIDHYPDDLYKLADIYDAASYMLIGSALMGAPMLSPSAFPSPVPDANTVKIEALTTIVASLGEMVKAQKQSQQSGQVGARPQRSTSTAVTGMSTPNMGACNFCGLPGHFI